MKVIRQLLREFWLPLLLGVAWTAFNVFDKPETWSVRKVLNVFGPTFFFMSWLFAQWYRVRKQQHVEEGIDALHAGVRALQSPLLPCGLFLTLRFEAEDADLRRVFGEQRGYRAYGPQIPMPPPPHGLPPGVRDGRLFSQDGYLDYRDGVVEAAGVLRTDHPGYNALQCSVAHTACWRFQSDACSTPLSVNEPLFATPRLTVELYLGGKPQSATSTPSLVLTSDLTSPPTIVGAAALDNTVIVDHALRSLAASPPDATGYSPSSLRGAFIRITADFFFIEGVASLPKTSWPRLHNLQLWLGGSGRQLIAFSLEELGAQITRENPHPVARGMAVMPQIVFECALRSEGFEKQLVSVA